MASTYSKFFFKMNFYFIAYFFIILLIGLLNAAFGLVNANFAFENFSDLHNIDVTLYLIIMHSDITNLLISIEASL